MKHDLIFGGSFEHFTSLTPEIIANFVPTRPRVMNVKQPARERFRSLDLTPLSPRKFSPEYRNRDFRWERGDYSTTECRGNSDQSPE